MSVHQDELLELHSPFHVWLPHERKETLHPHCLLNELQKDFQTTLHPGRGLPGLVSNADRIQ
jgi:hypothetical protein